MKKAIIFDMDGVISDTQRVISGAEEDLLKSYGIEMSADEITRRFSGVASHEMLGKIFEEHKRKDVDLNEAASKRWNKVLESTKGNIIEIPGTRDFIHRVKGEGYLTAVASASRLEFIKMVLSDLNLADDFDAIASAEEVERGKPDPAVFLLAAQKISVEPKNCVVVEDGANGMIAAQKAGMNCIGLIRFGNENDYPADIIVDNLAKISKKDIIGLLNS